MNLSLQEENARFKFIADNAAESFILMNEDGSFEYLNKEALIRWGYTAEEAVALRVPDVDPLHNTELFAELFSKAQQEEIPLFESVHRRKDGSVYPVEIKLRGMQFGSKKYLFAVARDIAARGEAAAALAEGETRFRNTFNQARIGILILRGSDFVVEMANNAYLQLVKSEEADVLGKPFLEALPANNQLTQTQLLAVLNDGLPFQAVNFPILVSGHNPAQVSYFDFLFHPLREEDGSVSGILATATEVTQTVKARHAISENEKQFRSLVMDSPIAMAIFRGHALTIEMVNAKMLSEFWRRSEAEVINKSLLEVFPELESQEYPQVLREVFRTGLGQSHKESVALVNAADGLKKFYVDYDYAPLFEKDGSCTGVLVTVFNVTEKVEARQRIEESELFSRTVLESSPDCVKLMDLQGDITFINLNGICILEGTGKEDFLSKQWASFWEPANRVMVDRAVAQASEGKVSQFVALSPTLKGTMKWWNVTVTPILDVAGNVISILGTSRDITEEKLRERELMESEQKFRLLADSMPQFVWTGDTAGNLNYFNQSVYEYSGLSVEQVREEGWLQIVHPDDKENNVAKWIASVQSGKDFLFEHRFKRFDGAYRWQLSRAIPKRDAQGNIQMWVGTSTDIEDQKTFAAELERKVDARTKELADSNIELAKMNKELESFAYISSHDLQEPLRKIQTFANQILENEMQYLSESGKDKFRRMERAAKRMQTLIDDLLSYSRTSNAKRVFEAYDLNLILNEVKEDLKDDLEQKQASIQTGSLGSIKIIAFQFRQLLYNLIGNSLKFSVPERKPVINIQSEIKDVSSLPFEHSHFQQHYCHITVADNGIGFEPEYSEKIFEVFQRLHGRNEYDGTGIGLAIVKKIVENHHGVITATGVQGQGARFDIFLPVAEHSAS